MHSSKLSVAETTRSPRWDFYNPVRITGGLGAFEHIHELVPGEGTILLVTDPGFTHRGLTARLAEQLGSYRVVIYDRVAPNPELDDLDQAVSDLRHFSFTGIVAMGGGSVMDTGKIMGVALVSTLASPLRQTLVEKSSREWAARLPVLALPTTSGTGAEVTPFATVWDRTSRKKFSLSSPQIYPSWAVLDPCLTLSLPAQETLFTGLDAFSHAVESLWNRNRTELSCMLATRALRLGLGALPSLLLEPAELPKRAQMQQASLLAGLAISQTRTAIAHSISYPFTSHFAVPHGLACSFTLPSLLDRYLGCELVPEERALLMEVRSFFLSLDLAARMRKFVSPQQCGAIWAEMHHPGRAENSVLELSAQTVREIVLQSLGAP